MSVQIKKTEFWIFGYLGEKMGEKAAREFGTDIHIYTAMLKIDNQ